MKYGTFFFARSCLNTSSVDPVSRVVIQHTFLQKLLYCCSITVVCIFSLPLTPPSCPCILHDSSCNPLLPPSPRHSPRAIVRLFLTSMSLVIFCLLVSFVAKVRFVGEIIWYLSLTAWLISLSIMLSSSIHAVAKGMSSFFLSAA